jgi:DNA-binding MarR family transcriptional regulator
VSGKKEAAVIFDHIVDIVRAVRSNRKIELFRGGMEKLNFAQMASLYFLYDSKGGMTMGELARLSSVKMPTMTEIMAVLVKAGYAARKHSVNDRRKVIMTITEKGRKLVDLNRGIGIDYIEKFLSNMSHIEKKIGLMVVERTKEILVKRRIK